MLPPDSYEAPHFGCVCIPALALQVALKDHPDWREFPAAVIEMDKPHARLLWVNSRAFKVGIRTGQRYSEALAFSPELRATPEDQARLEKAIQEIVRVLLDFSPKVEASSVEEYPGTFWLKTRGLGLLYDSARQWGELVVERLRSQEYISTVALGQAPFALRILAYQAAYTAPGSVLICRHTAAEQKRLARTPLVFAGLSPKIRDELQQLKIHTVGDFLRLPEEGIAKRFDEETLLWWRQARGVLTIPFSPELPPEPVTVYREIEPPSGNNMVLTFSLKAMLPELLRQCKARYESVAALSIELRYEDARINSEHLYLKPAAPTREERVLLDLIHLRFERLKLGGEVCAIILIVEGMFAPPEQLDWTAEKPRRDLAAANRALARLRAEFGSKNVVRVGIQDAHLPEAQRSLEPFGEMRKPALPESIGPQRVIRRVYQHPQPLPWKTPPAESLKNARFSLDRNGPYILSGGWWGRHDNLETERIYGYIETREGNILWVYYDTHRKQWFLQGQVE